MLLPYPVDLFHLMDFDVIDQLIEHPGGQNLGSCVFTDGGDKHIRRYRLSAELVHFSTEGLDLLGYLLLFIFVSAGHFGKAVIRELAGNIVLIDIMLFADGKSTRDSRISGARECSSLDGTK